MNIAALIGIGISLIILITLSGLFSFSEMVFATVNRIKIKKIASDKSDKKNKKAIKVLRLIDSYNQSMTSIVIMNNIVNILASTLSAIFFVAVFENNKALGSLMSFIIMTTLTIIFGELMPKMLAKRHSLKGSLLVSGITWNIVILFKPLTWLVSKFIKDTEEIMLESDEEIKHALTETHKAGHIEKDEVKLISKALDLDEKSAKEIMIPSKDVIYIREHWKIDKIKKVILDNPYTRFPVINKKSEIIGVINAKFFMRDLIKKRKFNMEKLIFDVSFFEKDMKLNHALDQLRIRKQNLAIVMDEKNNMKMVGILTIEDILEELVGELYDETDRVENGIITLDEDYYNVHWSALAKDVLKIIFNSRKKVPEKQTFKQFIKKELKIKKFEEGQHFKYRNSLIWVKDEKSISRSQLTFEIDIIK